MEQTRSSMAEPLQESFRNSLIFCQKRKTAVDSADGTYLPRGAQQFTDYFQAGWISVTVHTEGFQESLCNC